MSAVKEMLVKLSDVVKDNRTPIAYIILTAMTVGGEQLARLALFTCPSDEINAAVYGIIFIVFPPIVLLSLGFLVSPMNWRLCDGCSARKHENKNPFGVSCRAFCIVLSRAMIAPLAWIFVVLFNGDYVYCILSPGYNYAQLTQEIRTIKGQIQVYSWGVLLLITIVTCIATIFTRLNSNATYYQDEYKKVYRNYELSTLEDKMKKKATDLAEANVKNFFDQERRKPEWDEISKAPLLRVDYTETDCNGQPIYSPLHKWVVHPNRRLGGPPATENARSSAQNAEGIAPSVNA